jgi:hypothetical protein
MSSVLQTEAHFVLAPAESSQYQIKSNQEVKGMIGVAANLNDCLMPS